MQNTNSHRYKSYLVTLLMAILAFNFVDRLALGLVFQDIKADLDLSDSQLGLLSGVAFAVFYALMGIPIARWADRGNRVTIIGVTTLLWSVAVALCGLTRTFWQLMLIRIAVGFGEAGCVPPANSLIADYFTPAERPRAVSLYMQGIPLSVLIGYFVAGWLNQYFGWREMFVLLGLPGLVLAALAWIGIREPRRRTPTAAMHAGASPSLKEVCRTLWAIASYRQLLYAYTMLFFFSYGGNQWMATFFVRSFGMTSGELGTWLSVIFGFGCMLGTYLVGEWATRRAARNERLQLKGLAIMLCVSTIFGSFMWIRSLAPTYYWAFGWQALAALTGMVNGPAFAVIQTVVPERMRATAIALIYFVGNLIGMGLGPWATGAFSDALRPWVGEESLRYALLALSPGSLWVAWHFWRASNTVSLDIAAARSAEENPVSGDTTPPNVMLNNVTSK